jgi:xanthine dehydrogenase small subunit
MEFVLNGRPTGQIDRAPQTTLLDYVRDCGLTGAKEGCAEGECGACAVLLLQGSIYQPVNSCLVPLPAIAGQAICTVEFIAENGHLAPVQRAMVEYGGSQCGYCTPGFIVSMFAAHMNGYTDLDALSGNLCRCTGYRPIRDAFRSLEPAPATPPRPARPLEPIDYETAQGRFSRPCNLAEALRLAATNTHARFVAGNTDLGLLTNLRYQRFSHLISLEGIAELREFHDGPDSIEIGAALTLTEIEQRWSTAPPVFSEWIRLFASRLIRNRATLGGNLATASPIGDSAPLLLALDATLRLSSGDGQRTVPLNRFFRGYRETELRLGELIRSVIIHRPLPDRLAFYKVAKRRTDDISTVAAAFAQQGTSVRMGFGGVGPVPIALTDPERIHALKPISDHRGSAAYRLAMAQNLFEKFRASI